MGAEPLRSRQPIDPALEAIVDALARAAVAKHRARLKDAEDRRQ